MWRMISSSAQMSLCCILTLMNAGLYSLLVALEGFNFLITRGVHTQEVLQWPLRTLTKSNVPVFFCIIHFRKWRTKSKSDEVFE